MTESIFTNDPILWILYGIAMCLCAFELIKKATPVLTVLSVLIAVGATAYGLLKGMSLYEAATVMLIFLCVNLIPFAMHRGDGR